MSNRLRLFFVVAFGGGNIMTCLYGGRAKAEREVARVWSHVQYLDIQELESYECEYTSFFLSIIGQKS
jgi:hypothetical protein